MIAWVTPLGLDEKLLNLLETGGHATKILPFDNAVYFEYRVVVDNATNDLELFACLCLDRLVITMHERSIIYFGLVGVASPEIKLPEPSTTGLVCSVVIIQSIFLRRHAGDLRDRARLLASTMDSDPEAVSLAEILDLKQSVLRLDGVVSDQLAAFDILQAVDKPVLQLVRLTEIFQIAHGNTRATDRSVDRLDSGLQDLQRRQESAQQDKTNQHLAVLTIISAIFSPLTLLAGIYGMNFESMPELHFRYAYPIALGVMCAVAGGLYWYFRSRGWLK